jgi:hypothetical protein
MTTVHFKTASGENNTRRFNKNEGVSIYGKCTGVTGIYEPGTHVRINVTKDNQTFYFDEKNTDIFGDYDFWFRTPNEDTNLNVQIVATYSISGQDIVNIPLGIGNVNPKPLPNPKPERSWLDYLPLMVIAIAGIFIYKELK